MRRRCETIADGPPSGSAIARESKMPTLRAWRHFLHHSNHQYQLRAARAVLERADSSIDDALFAFDNCPSLGLKATERLIELAGPELVPPMLDRLESGSRLVRESVLEVLGHCRDRTAVDPVASVLLNDTDLFVRMQAAYALGRLRGKKARKALGATAATYSSGSSMEVMNMQHAIGVARDMIRRPQAC